MKVPDSIADDEKSYRGLVYFYKDD